MISIHTLGKFAVLFSLFTMSCESSIQHARTEKVKIFGNCGMCKETIEEAAFREGIASVNWNSETKIAAITYDRKQTNINEILKRIAEAGYDSEQFHGSNMAYSQLHSCCKYKRK